MHIHRRLYPKVDRLSHERAECAVSNSQKPKGYEILRYENETIPTQTSILLDFRSQQILSFLASVAGKELGDNDIIISCSQLFTRYILSTIRTNPKGPSYFLSQGIASSTALELLSLRGNNGPCLVLKVRNGRIRRRLAYIRY